MKKIYLFVFSITCISSLNAQITLTKSGNEPNIGDIYITKGLDSNGVALPMNIAGTNVTWNLPSIFETNSTSTNSYSANGGNASNFPGTTIVQEDQATGNFSYFKSSATSYELVGAEFIISGMGGALTYTNSAIIAQYPIAFGYTNTDAVAGTLSAASTSGPFSGSIKTDADGTGTLNLTGTSIPNCIRVKTAQHVTFSIGFGFVNGTIDQLSYNYFANFSKYPVFTVSYAHIQASGAQTIDQKVANISTLAYITIGIKENKLNDIIFKAYPNPANNEVNIHFVLTQNESYMIDIVNTLGQTVRSLAKPNLQPGVYSENISLEGLSAGVYHINVTGKNTKGVEKLVIQ